jgi:hypothetical protein
MSAYPSRRRAHLSTAAPLRRITTARPPPLAACWPGPRHARLADHLIAVAAALVAATATVCLDRVRVGRRFASATG